MAGVFWTGHNLHACPYTPTQDPQGIINLYLANLGQGHDCFRIGQIMNNIICQSPTYSSPGEGKR